MSTRCRTILHIPLIFSSFFLTLAYLPAPAALAESCETELFRAAQSSFQKNDYHPAIYKMTLLLIRYPDSSLRPEILLWLARACARTGRSKEALGYLNTLRRDYPGNPLIPSLAGELQPLAAALGTSPEEADNGPVTQEKIATAKKNLAAVLEAERIAAEQAAQQKAMAEKAKRDKQAAEKAKADKVAADRAAVEKARSDQAAAEKAAMDNDHTLKIAAMEKAVAEKTAAEAAMQKALAEKAHAEAELEKARAEREAAEQGTERARREQAALVAAAEATAAEQFKTERHQLESLREKTRAETAAVEEAYERSRAEKQASEAAAVAALQRITAANIATEKARAEKAVAEEILRQIEAEKTGTQTLPGKQTLTRTGEQLQDGVLSTTMPPDILQLPGSMISPLASGNICPDFMQTLSSCPTAGSPVYQPKENKGS